MKPMDILKAPLSLGLLALVMLAMAGVLLAASYLMGDVPVFKDSMAQMQMLDTLENDLSKALSQLQLDEAYGLYYLEYNLQAEEDYVAVTKADDEEITRLVTGLRSLAYYAQEENAVDLEALDEFDRLRAEHRKTYELLFAEYQVDDPDAALATIDALQDENEALDSQLDLIVAYANISRQSNQDYFPVEANFTIWAMAIGLVATLLLALAGYQRIAAAIEPLNALASAITAIGGGQYRGSLLAGLLKKTGPAGNCARKLDSLAAGLTERSAGQRQEIERLRQALYESRRRRLKIARPVEERRPTR